jgi:uncharacterized protein (UPF0332 family)
MNHLDFFETSEKLIEADNPTEADIRSAMSRSYYAVYHHVSVWWKSINRFPDYRDRAHAKIQMALYNAGIPASREFSNALKNLNSYRRDADYELTLSFDLEDGRTLLDLARRSVTAFDAIDKVALRDGIEDYLRKTNQL